MTKKFSQFTFDDRRRQIFRDNGDAVHVTPKAFDLLGLLIEAAPGVIRKTELHEHLWPGTFVSDATLVGLVKELRRALDDHDRAAPLIRTSYGVGYAFSGALENEGSELVRKGSLSVAVLPFANLSAGAQDDYFSDGLTEELINALAQLPGLRVASRTSAFQYRGNSDVTAIGRELHVDYVLEGSVRRAGKRLRITARLVNVADGCHLSSVRFEREMAHVFDIYDEIAQSIVKAVEPTLTPTPHVLAQRHSADVEAFELYLRGRHRWDQRTPESLRIGVAHFEAAIRLDPGYALAHAALADSYSSLAFYGYLPLHDARGAAEQSVRRALELGPELTESHYAAALCAMWLSPRWPEAEWSFRRALEIQPRFAPAHTHYAAFLAARRRFADARTHILEAIALDPLSPAVHGTGALCMFTSRHYLEALQFGKRALELHANFAVGLYALALTHCQLGELDKACDAFERLLLLSHRAPYFLAWRGLASSLAGRRAEALSLATEITRRHPNEYIHPLAHVLIGIALNDRAAAAIALAKYADVGGSGFQVAHLLQSLERWALEEPFTGLLERLHLHAPAAKRESA